MTSEAFARAILLVWSGVLWYVGALRPAFRDAQRRDFLASVFCGFVSGILFVIAVLP